jgi:predicted RNase H-like HicB family nuclease
MKEVTYVAAFKLAREGGYTVTFPDVPGAITEGDTLDEAMRNAREALELILEERQEAGDELPKRRALEALAPKIAARGAFAVPIAAAAPSKAVRINVTMDEALLERINRRAEETGRSRSALIAEALRKSLREDA